MSAGGVRVFALALSVAAIAATTTIDAPAARAFQGNPPITTFDGSSTDVDFHHLSGVAAESAAGKVFVADGNGESSAVDIFGQEGGAPQGVAPPYRLSRSFNFGNEPAGVAVDNDSSSPSEGDIYVADVLNHVVAKFAYEPSSEEYEYVCELTGVGGGCTTAGGTPTEAFGEVIGVAVGPGGEVYVSDYEHNAVDVFDAEGNDVDQITEAEAPGLSAHPQGLALDDDSNLYVQTYSENKVLKLTRNAGGEVTAEEVLAEGASGGVAYDRSADDLFIAFADHVAEYEGSGPTVLSEFGAGTLSAALGIAVNEASGNIYVSDNGNLDVAVFGAYGLYPDVVTGVPASVTIEGAALNGTVDPDGVGVDECLFEYGKTSAYGQTVPCEESQGEIGTGSDSVSVHAAVSGLEAGTNYHVRLRAGNLEGRKSTGADQTFTTLGPHVSSPSLAFVGTTSAAVAASINPNNAPTSFRVEYGTDASYGSSTALSGLIGSDGTEHSVIANLSGLQPASLYHYRFVAINSDATTHSVDGTFTTYPADASSPGNCPNEGLRTGPSRELPDCRAYELVTPADTGGKIPYATVIGAGVRTGNFPLELVSPLSESVLYLTAGGSISGIEGANGYNDLYEAVPSDSGWIPRLSAPSGAQVVQPGMGGASPDHRYSVWNSGGGGGSLAAETNFVRRPDGTFEMVGDGSIADDPIAQAKWITAGGSHVIFTSGHAPSEVDPEVRPGVQLEPNAPPAPLHAVYDRTASGVVHVVSLLPGDLTPSEDADYQGVSADGSSVIFTIGTALFERRNNAVTLQVASGPATFAGSSTTGDTVFYLEGGKISAFDAVSEATAEVAESAGATLVNVSADGSHAYFSSTVAIAGSGENSQGESATPGADNLYVWNRLEGQTHFVAGLDPSDLAGSNSLSGWIGQNISPDYLQTNGPGNNPSRTTPDGSAIVFQSRRALTPYDSAGHIEIYRYEEAGRTLVCVSCSPANLPAASDARLEAPSNGGTTAINALAIVHNLSDNGNRVFFETADALVPRDVDRSIDVYEWEAGHGVALISSGRSPADSPAGDSNYLYGVTPSGDDVFFRTVDALVPAAGAGGTPAIYDARVGGGFAEPSLKPCEEDACQSPPSPPALADPASSSLRGPGNLRPRHRVKRHHRHRHHKHAHRRRHSQAPGKRG